MSILQATRPPAKPTILVIRNASYSVLPIDPGFAGVAAVEVTRRASGDSYAVVVGHDGAVSCECPDYVVRHADHGTSCKHIRGVMAAGLLAIPAVVEDHIVDVSKMVEPSALASDDEAAHPLPSRRGPFVPTWEELQEAAQLLADRRGSCLLGEVAPPVGRRSRAPMPRPGWVGVNNTTDADNWPGGYC
jgi:hypothetical protein